MLLRYVVDAFDLNKRHSDKQVSNILARYGQDTASLHRGLIEYKLMAREEGGSSYWRL